ncbi:MAG: LysR family transcriptional regulator [Deltaproteobacteria bacterium]|nr:LysR family transcriptional regulator [Deltaproteobacteria bacterium]
MMSFNRAAEVLHCTQSTVSAQIKSLEEDLGTPVFERLGRRIALTPAGEKLRQHVRRLLAYEHEIRAIVGKAGETAGLISIRAPQSVVELHLPTILQRFCTVYPRVGFDIRNCGYYHLPDELRSGEIDAGFLFAMTVESVDLCNTEVWTETLAYVASPKSDLAKKDNLTIHDLTGQTILLPRHDCAYRMQLQQAIAEAHVDTAAIIELNSTKAVVQCLKAGIGVTLLPERAVAREITAQQLVKLHWHEPTVASLIFIRHRDKPLTGAYGAFVEMTEQYFTELRCLPRDPLFK